MCTYYECSSKLAKSMNFVALITFITSSVNNIMHYTTRAAKSNAVVTYMYPLELHCAPKLKMQIVKQ